MTGIDYLIWLYTCGVTGSMIGSAIFRWPNSLSALERELTDSLFWPVRAWRSFTGYQEKRVKHLVELNHQMLLSEMARHITAATHYMERARIAEDKYQELFKQFEDLKATQEQLNTTQEKLDLKLDEHVKTESARNEQVTQGTNAGLSQR